MHTRTAILDARRNALAFWLGCAVVTAGVILHLPMFLMARDAGYVMAGMPMDAGMLWGMVLIVGGVTLTGWGLLPKIRKDAPRVIEKIAPPGDAPLRRSH